MMSILFHAIQLYLLGYAIGLEDDGSIRILDIKILYGILAIVFMVMGIIILLIQTAITNPVISFDLSSAEWAIVILVSMGVLGGPFLIGLAFGRLQVHNKIWRAIKC